MTLVPCVVLEKPLEAAAVVEQVVEVREKLSSCMVVDRVGGGPDVVGAPAHVHTGFRLLHGGTISMLPPDCDGLVDPSCISVGGDDTSREIAVIEFVAKGAEGGGGGAGVFHGEGPVAPCEDDHRGMRVGSEVRFELGENASCFVNEIPQGTCGRLALVGVGQNWNRSSGARAVRSGLLVELRGWNQVKPGAGGGEEVGVLDLPTPGGRA